MRRGTKEFYRDPEGGWRWRAIAANGLKTAHGGEGYRRFADAKHGLWVTLLILLFGRTRIVGRNKTW